MNKFVILALFIQGAKFGSCNIYRQCNSIFCPNECSPNDNGQFCSTSNCNNSYIESNPDWTLSAIVPGGSKQYVLNSDTYDFLPKTPDLGYQECSVSYCSSGVTEFANGQIVNLANGQQAFQFDIGTPIEECTSCTTKQQYEVTCLLKDHANGNVLHTTKLGCGNLRVYDCFQNFKCGNYFKDVSVTISKSGYLASQASSSSFTLFDQTSCSYCFSTQNHLSPTCQWDDDDTNEDKRIQRCHNIGFEAQLASDSSVTDFVKAEVIVYSSFSTTKYGIGARYSNLKIGTHSIKFRPYNLDNPSVNFGNQAWYNNNFFTGGSYSSTTNSFNLNVQCDSPSNILEEYQNSLDACPSTTETDYCLDASSFTYTVKRICFDDVVLPACKATYQLTNFVGPTGTTSADLPITHSDTQISFTPVTIVKGTYQFKLKGISTGTTTTNPKTISQIFKMNIVCCSTTTSISYTASSIQTPQYTATGTSAYFAFSPFSQTATNPTWVAQCPISYTTDHSGITNPATLVNSDLHFVPTNPSVNGIYTFKITANSFGSTIQTSEQFQLIVGCAGLTSFTDTIGTVNQNLVRMSTINGAYTISEFTYSRSYCSTFTYEIINLKFDGAVSTTKAWFKNTNSLTCAPASTPSGCLDIVLANDFLGVITFEIRQHVDPGSSGTIIDQNGNSVSPPYFDSSTLTFTIVCGVGSDSLSPNPLNPSAGNTQNGFIKDSSINFVFQKYSSTSSQCPLTNIQISSSATSISPVTGLSFTYNSAATDQIISVDNTAIKKSYKFYIHGYVTGNPNPIFVNKKFTLDVVCGPQSYSVIQPDTTTFPDVQTRHLSRTSKNHHKEIAFKMPVFQPENTDCPVTDYLFSDNGGFSSQISNLKWERDGSFIYIYWNPEKTSSHTQNIYVKACTEGQETFANKANCHQLMQTTDNNKKKLLKLQSGCDQAWTQFQDPSIPAFVDSFNKEINDVNQEYTPGTFTVLIDLTKTHLNAESPTNFGSEDYVLNHPICSIETYNINTIKTHDGTISCLNGCISCSSSSTCPTTKSCTVTASSTCSFRIEDVIFTKKTDIINNKVFSFNIQAVAQGGATLTKTVSYTIVCGSNSVKIKQDGAVTKKQVGEVSRVANSFFTGLKLVAYDLDESTPNTVCPIQSVKLSSSCQPFNEIDSSELSYLYNPDGTLTVWATDNKRRKVSDGYKFAVYAEAVGGASYKSCGNQIYELEVECGPNSVRQISGGFDDISYPDLSSITPAYANRGTNGDDATFIFPKFQLHNELSNSGCDIDSYKIVTSTDFTNSILHSDMDFNSQNSYSNNDRRAWPNKSGGSGDKRNLNAEYDFYVAFVSKGGSYHISPVKIKFYVGCGHWVSITENPGRQSQTVEFRIEYNDNNAKYQFPDYFNTFPTYCKVTAYELYTSSSPMIAYPYVNPDNRIYVNSVSNREINGLVSGTYNTKYDTTVYVLAMADPAIQGTNKAPDTNNPKNYQHLMSSWTITFQIRCRDERTITFGTLTGTSSPIEVEVNYAAANPNYWKYIFQESLLTCTQGPCVLCTVDEYKVTTKSDSYEQHWALTVQQGPSAGERYVDINRYFIWDFKFYIQAITKDVDNSDRLNYGYSPQIRVNIICGQEVIDLTDIADDTVTLVYPLDSLNKTQRIEDIIRPKFKSSIVYDPKEQSFQPPYQLKGQGEYESVDCDVGKAFFIQKGSTNYLWSAKFDKPYFTRDITNSILCQSKKNIETGFNEDNTGNTGTYVCFCQRNCDPQKYIFYSDDYSLNAPGTIWSDQTYISMTNYDGSTIEKYKIHNGKFYTLATVTQQLNLFVKAVSKSGKFNQNPLKVNVIICGKESIYLKEKSPKKIPLALYSPGGQPQLKGYDNDQTVDTYELKVQEFSDWFQVDTSVSGSPLCTINRFYIFSDEACTLDKLINSTDIPYKMQDTIPSTFTETQFIQTSHLDKNLVIKTDTSGIGSFYLCALTNGGVTSARLIEYSICGEEKAILKDSQSKIDFEIEEKEQGEKKIPSSEFINLFESSDILCPVQKYKLVEKVGSDYKEYKIPNVQMAKSTSDLTIYYSFSFKKTLYVEAQTSYGKKFAYLPININIIEKKKILSDIVNQAPLFLQPIDELGNIQLIKNPDSETGQKFEIQLPGVGDANNDEFTIQLTSTGKIPKEKITFDATTGLISFRGITNDLEGTHPFDLILQDSKGKKREYTLDVKITMKESFFVLDKIEDGNNYSQNNNNQDFKDKDIVKPSEYILSAKIESVDQMGKLTIRFSTDVLSIYQENNTLLNHTNMDIYVDPWFDRMMESGFNLSKVNITSWNVTSFKDKLLTIKLEFASPIDISPASISDKIVVHFHNDSQLMIFAKSERVNLHYNYTTIMSKLQRQLADNDFNQNFAASSETADQAMKATMISTLVMNLFLAGPMSYFVAMINSLQLIIHLPIFNITMPSNVQLFFQAILPIVMFDILEEYEIFQQILDFDYDKQDELNDEVLDQFENLGYDSHNSLLILGTVGVVSLLWILRAILFWTVMYPISKFTKWKKYIKFVKNQRSALFFNEILHLGIEGCLTFAISGYFNLKHPLDGFNGENLGFPFGLFSIGLSCVFIPLSFIWLLCLDPTRYLSKHLKRTWGALFEGVNVRFGEIKMQAAFNFLFVMRRLIFLLIGFNLFDKPQFQLMSNQFLCLISLIYLGNYQPMMQRLQNKIEIVNDVFIAICSNLMMCYTDWILDEHTKFIYGWIMIGFIVLLMIFNLYYVLLYSARSIRLIWIRYYRRLKRFAQNKFKQIQEKFFKKEEQHMVLDLIQEQQKSGQSRIQFIKISKNIQNDASDTDEQEQNKTINESKSRISMVPVKVLSFKEQLQKISQIKSQQRALAEYNNINTIIEDNKKNRDKKKDTKTKRTREDKIGTPRFSEVVDQIIEGGQNPIIQNTYIPQNTIQKQFQKVNKHENPRDFMREFYEQQQVKRNIAILQYNDYTIDDQNFKSQQNLAENNYQQQDSRNNNFNLSITEIGQNQQVKVSTNNISENTFQGQSNNQLNPEVHNKLRDPRRYQIYKKKKHFL